MSKNGQTAVIVFVVLLFIYALLSIGICGLNYFHLRQDSNGFDDIIDNWQSGAIMNIQVAVNCSDGYEEAISYTWPGTKEGCDCQDVIESNQEYYNVKPIVYAAPCTTNQSKVLCSKIDSVPSQLVDVWSQVNQTSMKICVLKSQDTWASMAFKSDATCKGATDLRKCGITPDLTFCTTESQCPINDVKIISLVLPDNGTILANCTNTTNCLVVAQDSTSAKILRYKRGDTFDALPTTQITINEYGMCEDRTTMDITPGRKDFLLLNTKRLLSCYGEGDDRWNLTDSLTEDELFTLNDLDGTVDDLSQYGYYADDTNGSMYDWNLYSRSYIPWNIACRDNMDDIINNEKAIDSLRLFQAILLCAVLLVGALLGLGLPVLLYASTEKSQLDLKMWTGNEGKLRLRQVIVPRLGFGLILVEVLFMLVAYMKAKTTRNLMTNLVSGTCSTQNTMSTFTGISDDLHNSFTYDVINIVLVVIIFVVSIWYTLSQRI